MTQPPSEPSPSIYTRLDGSPLHPPATTDAPAGDARWDDAAPVAPGPQYTLATWGARLGAYLVDALVFGIASWLVMVPVGVALGLTVPEAAAYFARTEPLPESVVDPTPFYVAFVVQALIPGAALAAALLRMDGQTPGKRLVGLRVVRADGHQLDVRTAVRRELVAKTLLVAVLAVLTLGLGWLLNFLWPLWDRQHRAGHDMLAGTRVVQWPPRDQGAAPTARR